jgi:hypothetical protein
VRDREHVERVVRVRIFVTHQTEVHKSFVVSPAIDRQRRGVETLLDGLRCVLPPGGLTLTDVEIEADSFVELFLFRVQSQDRFQELSRILIVVTLERLDTSLVDSDGFKIGRTPAMRCRIALRR